MHYLPCDTGAVSSNNMAIRLCHYEGLVSFVGNLLAKIDRGLQEA